MQYIIKTEKSPEAASQALEEAVKANGFGVLHVHDLHATLNAKGVPFDRACKVFEVCNPKKAAAVLENDMALNMALPCRISVWQDQGQTFIGMINPSAVLSMFSQAPALLEVARDVEETTKRIIDQAAQA